MLFIYLFFIYAAEVEGLFWKANVLMELARDQNTNAEKVEYVCLLFHTHQ